MQTQYPRASSTPLPRTIAAIEHGIEQRLHIGAQLYVSRGGQVVADVALGEARRGVPMRTDTLMLWLSAGKPVTAMAVAQLRERGLLDWNDRVARHIPEFAAEGKDSITIRDVLTHTGGFRAVVGDPHWEDQPWERVIAAVCAAKLEPRWIPGETAGYHPLTSWYVLGEIVRRLDGRPFDRYARDEIFLPAGMSDCWMGIAEERQRAYGDRFGLMHDTRGEGESEPNFALDTPRVAAQCRPPSGTRGPIRELGCFYEMLLNGGQPAARCHPGASRRSVHIVSSKSVEELTSPQRVGVYDKTFRHTIDWGLGFIVQSNHYGVDTIPYGFGPHASQRTFGHSGSRSSIGYADPQHGLVVACLFNGAPDEAKHDARMREVNRLIYEELGLVG
jgi:CubicO group peptidase (beta-lactamase class C family)